MCIRDSFQAVVDQTITGLAQGRAIKGKVAFLGGPLFFFKELQKQFAKTLNLSKENAIFPELGQFSVAMGTAVYATESGNEETIGSLLQKIENAPVDTSSSNYLEPLFSGEDDYEAFVSRHQKATVPVVSIEEYEGDAYLGIDLSLIHISTAKKTARNAGRNSIAAAAARCV